MLLHPSKFDRLILIIQEERQKILILKLQSSVANMLTVKSRAALPKDIYFYITTSSKIFMFLCKVVVKIVVFKWKFKLLYGFLWNSRI
jgi:hypothetical protein